MSTKVRLYFLPLSISVLSNTVQPVLLFKLQSSLLLMRATTLGRMLLACRVVCALMNLSNLFKWKRLGEVKSRVRRTGYNFANNNLSAVVKCPKEMAGFSPGSACFPDVVVEFVLPSGGGGLELGTSGCSDDGLGALQNWIIEESGGLNFQRRKSALTTTCLLTEEKQTILK